MSEQRHDFTQETIRKLCDRVGAVCSNPACHAPTKGPHSDGEKAISVGMACHIHAAAPGGPRYDAAQTADDRRSIHNGIWLCRTCGTLIDTDEERFPAPVLRVWRAEAELAAFKRIGKPAAASTAPSDGLPLSDDALRMMRWLMEQYVKAGYPNFKVWRFTPPDQNDPISASFERWASSTSWGRAEGPGGSQRMASTGSCGTGRAERPRTSLRRYLRDIRSDREPARAVCQPRARPKYRPVSRRRCAVCLGR